MSTLEIHQGAEVQMTDAQWNRERIELVKRTYCKGSTDDELSLFVATCERTGLSPEARQIYAVRRWDNREKREIMSIQVSIDGFRLIADRAAAAANVMRGEEPTQWCADDGVWREEWISSKPPVAARYTTLKIATNGQIARFTAVARFDAYCQRTKDGQPTHLWKSMPETMIAKCAEALCLRKAYPAELSGLYTSDEMAQAAPVEVVEPVRHAKAILAQVHVEPSVSVKAGSIEEAAGVGVEDPFAIVPGDDFIAVRDAKKKLVAACGGDVDKAKALWGKRGSAPISSSDLAALLVKAGEASDIIDAEIVEGGSDV